MRQLEHQFVSTALGPALLTTFIWINTSEVFRYFAFIMPMMRETLSALPDPAPMSLSVFLVWGFWDLLLQVAVVSGVWIALDRFGDTVRVAVTAATVVWAAIFGIFWLGLFNMNLATGQILAIALPLSWLELVVAGLLILWARRRARSLRKPR